MFLYAKSGGSSCQFLQTPLGNANDNFKLQYVQIYKQHTDKSRLMRNPQIIAEPNYKNLVKIWLSRISTAIFLKLRNAFAKISIASRRIPSKTQSYSHLYIKQMVVIDSSSSRLIRIFMQCAFFPSHFPDLTHKTHGSIM